MVTNKDILIQHVTLYIVFLWIFTTTSGNQQRYINSTCHFVCTCSFFCGFLLPPVVTNKDILIQHVTLYIVFLWIFTTTSSNQQRYINSTCHFVCTCSFFCGFLLPPVVTNKDILIQHVTLYIVFLWIFTTTSGNQQRYINSTCHFVCTCSFFCGFLLPPVVTNKDILIQHVTLYAVFFVVHGFQPITWSSDRPVKTTDLLIQVSYLNHHEFSGRDFLPRAFWNTVMCLSIGTPKNNKFSICSKWKIYYF